MSAPSKLNLRPQERRLVAFVAIVFFVVLNIWLVWPRFGDWGRLKMDHLRARRTLDSYRTEIAKIPGFKVKLRELENAGPSVVLEEQELDLVRIVETQARLNRLNVIQSDPRPRVSGSQTNRFFEEQYQNLHVSAGNEELVNFLVSMTSTNSLIRVKDLTVRPDVGGTRLDSQMTLVASYQRAAPVRAAAPAPPPTPALRATNLAAASNPAAMRLPTRTNRLTAAPAAASISNRLATTRSRLTNSPARKP